MSNINLKFMDNRPADRPVLKETDNRSGYICYGSDNRYGDYLFDLYGKCSTMQAIINSTLTYTANFEETVSDDTIRRLILDYIIFGGFAVLVNRFADYTTYKWIDFKNIRTNKARDKFWYSLEWGKSRAKIINIPKYDKNVLDRISIFYFSGHNNRDGKVYPIPYYSGCILDLETDIEISNFWNNAINNNLAPSAIISFNNGIPDQLTQEEIEKQINKKFAGSDNASKTLISFSDNRDSAPTIERLAEDNFDLKYNALVDTIQKRIFAAFRCNPILAGINVETGFSKEEFKQAYDLYYITVILDILKVMKNELEKIGLVVDFKKLEIYADGGTGVSDADIAE